MRVSTVQIYRQGVAAFQQQQSKIAVLQQQISTGSRLSKPSDDPAASSRVLELEHTISLNMQYQVNINLADSRLSREESTLAAVENLTFRLQELAIRANNGAMDFEALKAIGIEAEERYDELLSLANARDANGDFLFAGFQNGSQPFVETVTGSMTHVVFNGDQGQRSLQIGESRQISVDNSGSELFLEIGAATALNERAAATNTGTTTMAPAQVFDASVYVPGNYEIRFTGPASYDVFDVTNAVNIVTAATYVDSDSIEFQGVRTSIAGAPAAGDVFSVSQGQYKSIFESLQVMVDTLNSSASSAQRSANFAETISELDGFLSQVLDVRTSIGGRLNALDSQKEINESTIVFTQATISGFRDTDLAAAISQLTLEQTTLDAAQAVFARITSSSLFNFLR
ncbi:MAG: flagellar hook-associated protein 3 FlgL [Planctomycetota bacterium]|jgi:flagellar hook-associated protein 3 FlgL